MFLTARMGARLEHEHRKKKAHVAGCIQYDLDQKQTFVLDTTEDIYSFWKYYTSSFGKISLQVPPCHLPDIEEQGYCSQVNWRNLGRK